MQPCHRMQPLRLTEPGRITVKHLLVSREAACQSGNAPACSLQPACHHRGPHHVQPLELTGAVQTIATLKHLHSVSHEADCQSSITPARSLQPVTIQYTAVVMIQYTAVVVSNITRPHNPSH
jgi:hypothetical protein